MGDINDKTYKTLIEHSDTKASRRVVVADTNGNEVTVTGGKLDVNATVNASIDTTGLATDTNQTNGSQKTQIVDAGGEAVTVTGGKLDVNASVDTTGLALDATLTGGSQKSQIVDAGGEAVTVTGGKLDVNASIDTTGLALESGGNLATIAAATKLEDSGHSTGDRGMFMLGVRNEGNDDFSGTDKDYVPFAVDAKGHQFVRLSQEEGENVIEVEVTSSLPTGTNSIGQVTANAGTNLNTSALALESGGNLASIKTNTDKIPSLGQALAAASVPVVLTAAQLTTLTPPAAITGFATETTLASIKDTSGIKKITDALPAGTNLIGKFGIDQVTANANEVVTKTGSVTNATLSAETTKVIGTVNVAASQTIAVTQATASSLNCTEASAAAIKTAVETIDNAISGSEMQVDIVASLPAGTNAIGKLSANSGVDIGDVDVTSLPALAAGTNAIGKLIPPDYDVTSHTAKAVKYYTNAGAVTDGIIWSPAAGKRWHVTTLFLNVSAAATITLEDDLAGGDSAVMKMELAANSGVAIPFGELYPLTSGEDAADLIITTTAGNIYVTAVGYEI